jgi:hypothetical protein
VGINREERVIHGIEIVLSPDDGTASIRGAKDRSPHLASPSLRMFARGLDMRVQSRRLRQMEFRQLEGLLGGFFRLAGRKLGGKCVVIEARFRADTTGIALPFQKAVDAGNSRQPVQICSRGASELTKNLSVDFFGRRRAA